MSEPCWTDAPRCQNPGPVCRHCGCSYFVFADSPDQGICHDCGRLFTVETEIDTMTRCVENKS